MSLGERWDEVEVNERIGSESGSALISKATLSAEVSSVYKTYVLLLKSLLEKVVNQISRGLSLKDFGRVQVFADSA